MRELRRRIGCFDRDPWSSSIIVLILALALYLLLGAHHLSLPGLHYDEAKEAGVNAMELTTRQPVTAFRDAAVQVGSWRLPLMVQDYIGSLNVLLAIPFLWVGGVTVQALRWLSLLIGAGTIVFVWAIGRRLGGPLPAAVAAILLAVNPSFVFWNRQGIFVTNLAAFLLVASSFTGLRWWEKRRSLHLWLTATLWGLGLYSKLLFVWGIGAMVAVLAAVEARRAHKGQEGVGQVGQQASRRWIRWGVGLLCFAVPLLPLILFNLQTNGTLASVLGNLGQSYYGVDNAAYLPNLMRRVGQMRTLLRGDHLWYLGEAYANSAAPWIAGGLLAATVAIASFEKRHPKRWAFLLPTSMIVLIVLQSAFTVSDLFITHYAMLLPLLPLAVGLLLIPWLPRSDTTSGQVRNVPNLVHWLRLTLVLCAVTIWGAGDLRSVLQYHTVLEASGGYSAHSDAIYDLASYLEGNDLQTAVALDWGFGAQVDYLTKGRIRPIEIFGYSGLDVPDEGYPGRVTPFLDNLDSVYIAHADAATVFGGRVASLRALAESRGLELKEDASIAERSGRALFIVYRAVHSQN